MIYKNKDLGNSSLFGDKVESKAAKPVDPAILEGFFRKQSISSPSESGALLNKKILRSSSSEDANIPGETFLGKSSSRSIFKPDYTEVERMPQKSQVRSSEYLQDVKKEIPQDIAEDLIRSKANFSDTSGHSGSHGSIRSDRISIFDDSPFDRIVESKIKNESISVPAKKEISKALHATDLVDSLWSKISSPPPEKSKIGRERAIDKLFGDKNG